MTEGLKAVDDDGEEKMNEEDEDDFLDEYGNIKSDVEKKTCDDNTSKNKFCLNTRYAST